MVKCMKELIMPMTNGRANCMLEIGHSGDHKCVVDVNWSNEE